MGYLPDMYWGDALELSQLTKTYTFNGTWKKFGHLVLPTFETTYTANLGDYSACSTITRAPGVL
jgi:hypothetical protein